MIMVSFACNNPDNGIFAGMVDGIEIHGHNGCDIALECPNGLGGRGPDLRIGLPASAAFTGQLALPLPLLAARRENQAFQLKGAAFPCFGWRNWYGNWCWDATRMAAVEVLRLCKHLRKHGWHCTESDLAFAVEWTSGGELSLYALTHALKAGQ